MSTTVFLRLLEAEDKAAALLAAVGGPSAVRFDSDPDSFAGVPRSPFAYWAGSTVLSAFRHQPPLHHEEAVRLVCSTNPLNEDVRYARTAWEVRARDVGISWVPWAKGGAFSRFYFDIHTLIHWSHRRGTFHDFVGTANRPLERPAAVQHFLRPGLTWPRRTQGGLSLRAMPAGCIFGDKGPAVFVDKDQRSELLALLSITNSSAFRSLVDLQMSFGSYEVGVLQRTPVPRHDMRSDSALAGLALRAWSCKRTLDQVSENSHAFTSPALVRGPGATLPGRAEVWSANISRVEAELAGVQVQIDRTCFRA